MFATLGWWIVVACRWCVNAGFLTCVSVLDWFDMVCDLCTCCACGCTCLQSLVGGSLLLACGLSKLGFLICASLIELVWDCVQFVYMLFACGCTCLQIFAGGLLLLVCGLSTLAVSLGASMIDLC